MKTKLDNIEKALQIAAKHKYGDGDYTTYFEKALADIKWVKEEIQELSAELKAKNERVEELEKENAELNLAVDMNMDLNVKKLEQALKEDK